MIEMVPSAAGSISFTRAWFEVLFAASKFTTSVVVPLTVYFVSLLSVTPPLDAKIAKL